MTLTEKIPGEVINVEVDVVLGNDVTGRTGAS
jgi:hypothetical protein